MKKLLLPLLLLIGLSSFGQTLLKPGQLDPSYTTTTTAAGTTTLTVNSTQQQYFTGSTTQTVTLPVTSTLSLGWRYVIVNNSTGAITVNSSGANAVLVLAGGTSATVTCILTTGTTAASWSFNTYDGIIITSGKALSVSNSVTLAGTDGTTMTFPSTSATIARTDAANTFTGHQTIEGVTSTGATGTGALVFGTSPTLATPVLGTPTSVTLNNTSDVIGGVTMTLGSDGTGDIYYRSAGGVLTRLAIGSTNNVLTVTAGLPAWSAPTTLTISNFVYSEVPSGTVNGANVTFTLANTPTSGTVALYKNGQRLKITSDYTISTGTLTMVSAPLSGDLILADYQK